MTTAERATDQRVPTPHDRPAPRATTIHLSLVLLAGFVAFAIGAVSLSKALAATGLPNPGELTTYGLPFVRSAGELSAVIGIGALLVAAFLVPPQPSGVLDVDGYRAVRTAILALLSWAGCAVLMVPLTLSDVSGVPITQMGGISQIWSTASIIPAASAWRTTAFLALIVAVIAMPVLRWGWTPVLLVLAMCTMLPLALGGHASAGGSHDVATGSMILHLGAASLWVGGLVGVLVLARGSAPHLSTALRRFSTIAAVCLVAMGVSGVLNALVRVRLGDVFTTSYGWLLVAKTLAFLVLGLLGYAQRQKSMRAIADNPANRRPLIMLAGFEVALMAATMGIGVGLGRTPPPPPANLNPSITEVELGYNLAGPPTFARLAFDWRFDLIFGTLSIAMAVIYAIGLGRLRRRGDSWPIGRSIAWFAGCAVLLVATSSGVGRYSTAMFSVHMGSHMALSMLAPILFALGGPMTLALRTLTPAGKNGVPGLREWLLAFLHSRFAKVLSQPVVASVIFVGGFYALYLGGIYDRYADEHFAHIAMNTHFLLSGYLFYWVVIGVDPAPRQIQPVGKLAMVFGSLPFHAFFGVALMSMNSVLAESYFHSLALPWNTDLLADQRAGGGIAWAAGEIPLVLVMLALLVQWSRSDRRAATRLDRAAERDDDAALVAHNAMFARLAEQEGRHSRR